jgi:4-amino-4-deoxy-L-arabinose transferase-like glycosyltransferase
MTTTDQRGSKPSPLRPIGEQTGWPVLIIMMVVAIVPILTVSQIAAHARIDVVDDQMFGYFGWRIAHGATLYNDVWDNKPPGIYWTNALGFLIGGDSYAGVIALCSSAVGVALIAFFVVCNSVYFRGAAAVATILAAFYLTHGFFQGGTNRTETFLMACELVAMAFYVRGYVRAHWWNWYLAGVCCGCAALYKQVGLAGWGALGLHVILLVILRDLPWRTGLRRCLLLLVGMLTSIGAAAFVIYYQGAADLAAFAIFGFNRAYFTLGRSSWFALDLNDYMLRQHMSQALLLPILMSIAALIHSSLWALRPKHRPAEIEKQLDGLKPHCPRYMLLFFLWYVIAYYGAMVSPHYFRHYLLPTFPPLMLMASYLIHILRGEIHLTKRLQQRIWVTACFVAMGYFALEGLKWHYEALSEVWVFRLIGNKQAEWETVGDAAARMTAPEDHIQCLGYMPGVYLRARRINSSRYTTTEKLGQAAGTFECERIRRELKAQLEADPPTLMIMSNNDYYNIDNATDPGPPSETMPYPDWLGLWLREFIHARYQFAVELTEVNVTILKRVEPGAYPATERAAPPAETR